MATRLQDVLDMQRMRLEAINEREAAQRLIDAVRATRGDLMVAINRLAPRGDETYTLHKHRQYLLQADEIMIGLGARFTNILDDSETRAIRQSASDTAEKIMAAAAEFGETPIPVGVAQVESMLAGDTILRTIEAERALQGGTLYTQQTVGSVERALAQSLMSGESVHQAAVRLGKEDLWRPRYSHAELIARTEISNAYNAAGRRALDEIAVDEPSLWIMWYEHAQGPTWGGPRDKPWPGPAAPLDKRVGEDSLRLHGQLRRPGEPFVDPGTGRTFMHPPNRPNDRATVIGVYVSDTGKAAGMGAAA